jgi:hypothetical protein
VQSAGFLCLHEDRGEGVIWIPELTNSGIAEPSQSAGAWFAPIGGQDRFPHREDHDRIRGMTL